jgi:hypothetical protein
MDRLALVLWGGIAGYGGGPSDPRLFALLGATFPP